MDGLLDKTDDDLVLRF